MPVSDYFASILIGLEHIAFGSYSAAKIDPEDTDYRDIGAESDRCHASWPKAHSDDWCGEFKPVPIEIEMGLDASTKLAALRDSGLISTRLCNVLHNNELHPGGEYIRTLGDVANHTLPELRRVPNLGRLGIEEISNLLAKAGLSYRATEAN